ncbi:hypothetical protein B0T25DRAFT_542031 [Lasiosphaeria hispida]|uniref:Uncharacterized protein n=1 Tax=Lasiosphaeria hispida TaxID=260671 RepID=A0AAJ0MDJ6_9PEZI|nr:hypothetical protein B0T25DRAFT_542031 [Lasiosphaeria hispida]
MELRVSILLLFLCQVTLCFGSGCKAPPCGRVVNKTRWSARWADLSPGDHKCHVYNWNGGDGSVPWSEKRVKCTQHSLDAHSSKGGFTHDLTDVDGITFHNRRWRIIWEDKRSYDFAEGVWAKIGSGETITCTENKEVPECKVKCDTDLLNACIGK